MLSSYLLLQLLSSSGLALEQALLADRSACGVQGVAAAEDQSVPDQTSAVPLEVILLSIFTAYMYIRLCLFDSDIPASYCL